MTRWKEGEKEFEVKLTDDYAGSIYCRVPKPIFKKLGKPKRIRFEILRKRIVVIPGKKSGLKLSSRSKKLNGYT